MQREVEIEALEAQEVQEALKSGSKTPMQLAAEGKTSAVPPPVLK